MITELLMFKFGTQIVVTITSTDMVFYMLQIIFTSFIF